eukprot:193009-Hanusia_phi.AAC.1
MYPPLIRVCPEDLSNINNRKRYSDFKILQVAMAGIEDCPKHKNMASEVTVDKINVDLRRLQSTRNANLSCTNLVNKVRHSISRDRGQMAISQLSSGKTIIDIVRKSPK